MSWTTTLCLSAIWLQRRTKNPPIRSVNTKIKKQRNGKSTNQKQGTENWTIRSVNTQIKKIKNGKSTNQKRETENRPIRGNNTQIIYLCTNILFVILHYMALNKYFIVIQHMPKPKQKLSLWADMGTFDWLCPRIGIAGIPPPQKCANRICANRLCE